MSFDFRIPFRLPPDRRVLASTSTVLVFASDSELVNIEANAAMSSADRLALRGTGYLSETSATSAAREWGDWLALSLIPLGIGMDTGVLRQTSTISDQGMTWAQESDLEGTVVREHAGIFVFPTEPPARFIGLEGVAVAGTHAQDLVDRVLQSRDHGAALDPRLRRSSDVFALAMALPTNEARFITIIAAIEGLVEKEQRDADVVEFVRSLITLTNESPLDEAKRVSIVSSLRRLESKSIGGAGETLALRLGDGEYGGKSAVRFWKACYTLRSKMTHGGSSTELLADIALALPQLQRFYADLFVELAAPAAR